jgi:TolB protein
MARRMLPLLTVALLAALAPSAPAADGTIAFQSTRADGNMEIHVMDGDGTHVRRLTRTPGYDHAPVWSPDGRRIAFMSDRAGPSEIHLMRADGSRQHRFSHSTTTFRAIAGYAFDPLTGRLAFRAEDDDGTGDLYASRLDGGGRTQLTHAAAATAAGAPAWSPDGARLAFALRSGPDRGHDSDIWVMRPDGSDQRRLTATADMAESGPVWSPDGRRLAFWSGAPGRHGRIEVMRADGSRRRAVTTGDRDATPAWSPDGMRMAFTRETAAGRQIHVVDADGGVPLRLTAAGDNAAPSWVGRRRAR